MESQFGKYVLDNETRTLTIITTYTCTAACKECCFGCSPSIQGRLTLEEIKSYIVEAKENFRGLEIVVFTGGECFLLKDDLYSAIAYCSELGLKTRCVTNAFWGRTAEIAERTTEALAKAGLTEINISTGHDHQQFVPQSSVVSAAEALVRHGIPTLVTVEQDPESSCVGDVLARDERILNLLRNHGNKFRLQRNIWMQFTHDFERRNCKQYTKSADTPCTQLFSNIVVTPHRMLSGCCGLTFEYIPEMKLGMLDGSNMRSLYESQTDDFLKIWLATKGPVSIIRDLVGMQQSEELLNGASHICQACVVLHQSPEVRKALQERWQNYVPAVMTDWHTQLFAKRSLEQIAILNIQEEKHEAA